MVANKKRQYQWKWYQYWLDGGILWRVIFDAHHDSLCVSIEWLQSSLRWTKHSKLIRDTFWLWLNQGFCEWAKCKKKEKNFGGRGEKERERKGDTETEKSPFSYCYIFIILCVCISIISHPLRCCSPNFCNLFRRLWGEFICAKWCEKQAKICYSIIWIYLNTADWNLKFIM